MMVLPIKLEIKRLKSYARGAVKTKVFVNNTEITRLWIGQNYTHEIEPGKAELFFQTWKIKTKSMKLNVEPNTSVQLEFKHEVVNLFRKEVIPCLAVACIVYFLVSKLRFCILGCQHLFWEMILLSMLLIYPFIYALYAHYKHPVEFYVKVKILDGSGAKIQEDSLEEESHYSFTKKHFIFCLVLILVAPFPLVTYIKSLPHINCLISLMFGGVCHKSMYW